jgi:hypothetical protein
MWTRGIARLCGLFGLWVACTVEPDEPAPPVAAGITGTVVVAAGGGVDPVDGRVAAYAGRADFDAGLWYRQARVVRDGERWTFDLDLQPGSYYVDVWKDADGDGQIGGGDAYGFHSDRPHGPPAAVAVGDGRAHVVVEVRATPPAAVDRQRDCGRLSCANSQWIRWSSTASTYASRRF